MISYHGKSEVKEYFVNNAIRHRKADAYVQDKGNYDGKRGCMIACSFKAYDHELAPKEAGVPIWLAKLADRIFENLTKEDSDLWTERFWAAIPVGVDLEKAKAPFLIFVLESTFSTFDCDKYRDIKSAVSNVIELLIRDDATNEEFETARTAADAAAAATTYDAAAAAVARAAAYAAAAYTTDADAAYTTAFAAAAYTTAAAAYADADADAIRSDIYKKFSNILIEILQSMGGNK